MVGGMVEQVTQKPGRMQLLVRGAEGHPPNDRIFVDVPLGSDVEVSDIVWWQGGNVYVTRGSRFEKVFADKLIPRIGYSYGFHHVTTAP
jgi:hypothetical protein